MCHPPVQSFDFSVPARLAAVSDWDTVRRYYDRPSASRSPRCAGAVRPRLALFLLHYRHIASMPWQPLDEALLNDDADTGAPVQLWLTA